MPRLAENPVKAGSDFRCCWKLEWIVKSRKEIIFRIRVFEKILRERARFLMLSSCVRMKNMKMPTNNKLKLCTCTDF